MSLVVTVRKKRDAAKLRKFIKRQALTDDTGDADLSVGNQVHLWLNQRLYMAWAKDSADSYDTHVTIRKLYARL